MSATTTSTMQEVMVTTTTTPATTPQIGPPPPFDPELAAVLPMLAGIPKFESLESIPAAREFQMAPPDDDITLGGRYTVEERTVPGPAGAPDISLVICRPVGAARAVPVVYHIHGGGMVVGDATTFLSGVIAMVAEFDAAVVSVEYRLAPETPHPGPVEDCYAGLVWTAAHADELGIDPARIVIAGASAGGGLAAATTLLSRDRRGPEPLAQLLMCPMLDDRNETPSSVQMEGLGGLWDRVANETGWTALLGAARGTDDVSPYAAPARATDLSGLPATFIDVGSAETFRDEAVTYASRIWQAGGRCELHVLAGGWHGYDVVAPQAAVSQDTEEARRRWLRRVLGA
ncbi:alpha/beta hydrolase [Antribacter sp. KLBMP9083]|uniref:Alpha/beta hydrolase n=1 Tax=Antribacter soli TaxID=2910976 RepID=A0AA41QBT2_9MICO|nr:alpha/beta hydrolase [Antribacter soli]MCF4120558.1 alpha/beta hydrolase [Antribacter soli]